MKTRIFLLPPSTLTIEWFALTAPREVEVIALTGRAASYADRLLPVRGPARVLEFIRPIPAH